METILVFSDLHGDSESLDLLIERMTEENVDCILCAGDLGLERLGVHREKLKSVPIPFITVRGNCDTLWIFSESGFRIPTMYVSVSIGARTIFLTHGDVIHSWQSFPAKVGEEDIFITGHTHVAHLSKHAHSPYLLNPGSASSPRDGRPPSYAIVTNHGIVLKDLKTRQVLDNLLI